MITARCTCGATYQVKTELAGRVAKCKRCGEQFEIQDGRPKQSDKDTDKGVQSEQSKSGITGDATHCCCCESDLPHGAVICVACGTNQQTGEKIGTTVAPEDSETVSMFDRVAQAIPLVLIDSRIVAVILLLIVISAFVVWFPTGPDTSKMNPEMFGKWISADDYFTTLNITQAGTIGIQTPLGAVETRGEWQLTPGSEEKEYDANGRRVRVSKGEKRYKVSGDPSMSYLGVKSLAFDVVAENEISSGGGSIKLVDGKLIVDIPEQIYVSAPVGGQRKKIPKHLYGTFVRRAVP